MPAALTAWERIPAWIAAIGRAVIGRAGGIGAGVLFLGRSLFALFRPPFRTVATVQQMHFVGNRSVSLILLTSAFTGMVLVLQGYTSLERFGSIRFVGSLVALTLIRELGPVLAALMVMARAGSAITAIIGNMRVTEQIDALESLAVDPVHYLVVPRLVASLIVVPLTAAFYSVCGIATAYVFGVAVLHVDGGLFMSSVREGVEWSDVWGGILKSFVFALLIAWISCYRGYTASGGAMGVGRATSQAVVDVAALVLLGDYVMTAFLY